jgi:PIN domain nuclease of toxin-antitoxin system
VARYLIDSHIFFWAGESPAKLLAQERSILSDTRIDVVVSVASIWELSIKIATGRLAVPGRTRPIASDHFVQAAARVGIPIMPIDASETEHVRQLPRIHGDPFDRLLIAQALLGGRTIMTRDAVFSRYPGVQVFAA